MLLNSVGTDKTRKERFCTVCKQQFRVFSYDEALIVTRFADKKKKVKTCLDDARKVKKFDLIASCRKG